MLPTGTQDLKTDSPNRHVILICVKLALHIGNNKTCITLQLPVVWSINTFVCFHHVIEGLRQLAHSKHLIVDKQPLAADPLTEQLVTGIKHWLIPTTTRNGK